MDDYLCYLGYTSLFAHDPHSGIQEAAWKQIGGNPLSEASQPFATIAPSSKLLLDLPPTGDKLIVSCLDRIAQFEHTLLPVQQPLQAEGIPLIVLADETRGGSYAL
jgi:hypothetical protein